MFRAGSRVASLLPGNSASSLAQALGRLTGMLPDLDGRRELVASHLERVAGKALTAAERRRMVPEVWASYARYWAESLRLPSVPYAEVAATVACIGLDNVQEALARGRGAIVVAPHLGGWEWGAFYLAGQGLAPTVVVEPLEPPDLFAWFAQFRSHLGMEVVPLGTKAPAAVLKALKDNKVVCLLADRLVPGASGIEVEFFGGATDLPAGPVTLAMRSQATLMTAAIYYDRPEAEHTIVFNAPMDLTRFQGGVGGFRDAVKKGTQAMAEELEELIRAAPEQWHLLQPNWRDDPPLRKPWSGHFSHKERRR